MMFPPVTVRFPPEIFNEVPETVLAEILPLASITLVAVMPVEYPPTELNGNSGITQ
jgi:hypothetical protein